MEERNDNDDATADPIPKTIDSALSSLPVTPHHDPSIHMKSPSPAKTPGSGSRVHPSHGEMHPSKVRHSTTKQADSGLVLGFRPIKKDMNGNTIKDDSTPTKSMAKSSPASQFGTPGFEFKFASHESQLSEDSKKLMESLRGDVAKVKEQLREEQKKKQAENDGDAQQPAGRKIAKPKGMSDRFSSAHMAEFKKMDSIAHHPSAFRATPGRFQPVVKNLKRTPSKANLNANEQPEKGPRQRLPEQSHTPQKHDSRSPAKTDESPAKRVKHTQNDDAGTHREPAQGSPAKTAIPRPGTVAPRNPFRTPTRPTSVRPSTLRPHKTSMISTPTHRAAQSSSLKPAIASPAVPRTEFNPRLKSNLPTLGNLKSILRRSQPIFSRDTGTAPVLNKGTTSPHGSSVDVEPVQTPSPKKRVGFSLGPEPRGETSEASPSPTKTRATEGNAATRTSDVIYPTLPAMTPEDEAKVATTPTHVKAKTTTPTIRRVQSSDTSGGAITTSNTFSNLPGIPHGIQNKKRRRGEIDDDDDTENVPPTESTPDPRTVKKMKLTQAAPSASPSPVKTTARTPVRSAAQSQTPVKSRTPASARATPGRSGGGSGVKAKAKPTLSMSRLNMLAKPKERR